MVTSWAFGDNFVEARCVTDMKSGSHVILAIPRFVFFSPHPHRAVRKRRYDREYDGPKIPLQLSSDFNSGVRFI